MPQIKFEQCDHCKGTTQLQSGRKCNRCENGVQAKQYLTCVFCGASVRDKTLDKTLHVLKNTGCRLVDLV